MRTESGARWVVATSNAGKLREFAHALAPFLEHHQIALVSQSELGISPADEPHDSFAANAMEKARHASAASGLPAIADDSGLSVDALGGAPGVRSARFFDDWAGPKSQWAGLPVDEANLRLVLALMEGQIDRKAAFHCAIAFVRSASDPNPILVSGLWRGAIAAAPMGVHGFGYDPIFMDAASGKTAAQLSIHEKEMVSHRGQALQAFLHALSNSA